MLPVSTSKMKVSSDLDGIDFLATDEAFMAASFYALSTIEMTWSLISYLSKAIIAGKWLVRI